MHVNRLSRDGLHHYVAASCADFDKHTLKFYRNMLCVASLPRFPVSIRPMAVPSYYCGVSWMSIWRESVGLLQFSVLGVQRKYRTKK